MSSLVARLATAGLVLGAALVANPPPGALLGVELGTTAWAGLFAAAALAGLVTVLRPAERFSYVAWGVLVLPLLGPAHAVFTTGFFAAGVGALAAVLHLELLSFADRRRSWARTVGDDVLARYDGMHRRSWLRLGGVLLACLAALAGGYALVLELTPPSFADSLEARQVEGVAGVLLAIALLALGVLGLTRTDADEEGSA